MGNVVVWKPADSQVYSAWVVMEIFRKAGLPDGVINLVYMDGPEFGEVVFKHPDFAGLHFNRIHGGVQSICGKKLAAHIDRYKAYPPNCWRNGRQRLRHRPPFRGSQAGGDPD